MMSQVVKKISKFFSLLAFREAYFYCRNLLGLTKHPQLTISRIFRQKDKSQFMLIFGLPFYTFLAGVVFIFALKKLIFGKVFNLGFLAKSSLLMVAIFSLLAFYYLFYWLIQVWKYRGKNG